MPSGWTVQQFDLQQANGFSIYSYVATKIATSADTSSTSYTFGFTSSAGLGTYYGCDVAITTWSGGDTGTQPDASAFAVVPNGTTATSPSATATVSNDTAVLFYLDLGNTGATPSLPSGTTSALAYTDGSSGTGIRIAYAPLSATGTSPTYTSTYGETVNPSGGVFGTMFTVLVKGVSSGTTVPVSIAEAASAASAQSVAIITSATQAEVAAATDTITTGGAIAAAQAEAASGADSLASSAQTAAVIANAGSAADSVGTPPAWAIEQVYQASQKWHVGSWSPTTLSVTCNAGDSLIVCTNQWNSDAGATFLPTMSPGGLTTIYDPEAAYLGTAEPVFAQALAAFNLAAGTYTITPPNLGGPGGDGDVYVLRVSGISGLRSYGANEVGGGATTTGNYTAITATLQSADVAGDLLVSIGGTDNNTTTTTLTVATPPGFTNLAKQTDGTNSPPSSFDYGVGTGAKDSAAYTWPDYASPVGEAVVMAFVPATAPSNTLSSAEAEAASATDTITQAATSAATENEAASAADASGQASATTAIGNEAASAAEAPASAVQTVAAEAEAATAADASFPGAATQASRAESASAVDASAQAEQTSATQADSASAADTAYTGNTSTQEVSEPGAAADSVSSLVLAVAQIGESATAAAIAAYDALTNAAQQDAAAASDASAAAQAGVSSVSESSTAGDAPISNGTATAASAEAASAADQTSSGNSVPATSAETVTAQDLASATVALLSAAQEIATATDAMAFAASALANAAEQAQALEIVGKLSQLAQSIAEGAAAVDAVSILQTLAEIAEWQFYAAMAARSFYAAMPARSFYAAMPFRSFYALCTSDMATQIQSAIDPGETKVLTLDATADLPAGVTLTGTPTVSVIVTRGTDANAAAHFIMPTINTTPVAVTNANGAVVTIQPGLCVQLIASGCLDGCWYEVRATCQTTQGNNVEVLKAVLTCTAS